jgi:uncharacterized protein
VLFVAATVAQIALRTGRTEQETELLLRTARGKLRLQREQRSAPFVDRTRYTGWNAMMASAMLRAGAVLADEWATGHALLTLQRIRQENESSDAVAHTPGGVTGLLDDQVQTSAAALDAHEATGDPEWLSWSLQIMDRVWSEYWDGEEGGLFDTARSRTDESGLLPARAKPVQDTPTPSPNGVAAVVALRLYALTGRPEWQERATALLAAFAGRAAELGLYAATYLLAVDWHVNPATHLVVVGEQHDPAVQNMHLAALADFVPRRAVQLLTPDVATGQGLPPALQGMLAVGQSPRGYACTGNSCSPPAGDPSAWQATLESLRGAVTA